MYIPAAVRDRDPDAQDGHNCLGVRTSSEAHWTVVLKDTQTPLRTTFSCVERNRLGRQTDNETSMKVNTFLNHLI